MYNIKLAGLDTGKKYYVKVRAKVNGYETSEWSLPFMFETPRDTMPPGRVENVSFVSEGDSFIAKWEAPRFNEDGSVCGDVSHYRLIFKDLDRNVVREERTVDTTYAMDFNKNIRIFGQPAGRIELTISAVDLSGNEGQTVVVIAQNPPPAKVQNVTAAVGVEAISLKWDANEENDLAHYELHTGSTAGFAVSSSTLRAKIAPGTNTHTHDTASLTMLYFKIVAVDKFNQKSEPSDVVSAQPRLTTDYDKEPPGAVAGFTVVQLLAADSASTIARMNFTARTEDDLDKYEVQYRKTGETSIPWSFTNIPSDQTSAEVKPLPLSTSYDFRIRAVDFNANKGAWSSVVVAAGIKKTTLPAAPTGIVVTGGLTNLMIRWNASTDASMANWGGTYEVQISKATSFTSPITIKTASTLASFINLDANTVYYVRIRSIDPYLNTGAWSTTTNGNTGTVSDPNASKITWSDTQPTGGKTNDLWIKIPENVQYRYNGTTWVKAQDSELASGIASAIASADGKNTIYYSTPPASGIKAGDTWFDGATIKVYQNGSWVDVSTALDNAQAAQAIQIAGSKNKTYYVSRATATGMIEGDTLFDTTEGNKQYRYNGTTWVSVQDAAIAAADQAAGQAQQTADNKNTIYYSTPPSTGLKNGDTWFDGPVIKTYRDGSWIDSSSNLDTQKATDALQVAGSKNKTYYTTYANRPTTNLVAGDLLFDTADKYKPYRWNGTAWEDVRDGTIKDADDKAAAAQQTANSANTAVGNLVGTVGDLTTQVDNKVEVWFQTTQPAIPASAADRLKMKGDIWINTTTGALNGEVRMYPGSGTTWNIVKDPAALAAAQSASTLAGTKKQVFGGNTAPANNAGNALTVNDLWIRDTDKKMHRWTGTSWEVAQDYKIDASALKGNNLVFNGRGELGDNTNWPGTDYTAVDAPPGSKGSFIVTGKKTITLSEFISVNPYANYNLSVWAKRVGETVDRSYLFVSPFDAYNMSIQPYMYMYRPGSTTQLTADLKPGDTSIQVVSTANWFANSATTNYGVIFWDYVDPGGKLWPKETYSRNYYNAANSYDATGVLPATSIPLRSPWTGPLKPAGTWISSGLSGGSYMYNALSATTLQPDWIFYKSGNIGGIHDTPASSASTKFPLATASIKLGFLANYDNNAGAIQAYSGLDFSDVTAAQDMATSAMTSANARNRNIYSTANASGTTLNGYAFINGDTWFRKDANNTVIAMWEFLNGAWIAKTLNNAVIANLDAGKINAGTINADRIGANSIDARKLIIGRGENLVNDPNFQLPIGQTWQITSTGATSSIVPEGVSGSNAYKLVKSGAGINAAYNMPEANMQIESGASLRVVLRLKTDSPIPAETIGVQLRVVQPGKPSNFMLFYVPAQAIVNDYMDFDLGINSTSLSGALSWGLRVAPPFAGTVWFDNVSVMRATGTTMIENGAITTDKIKANAVTATQIAGETITASEIAAGAITAHKIKAGEIDATKIVSGGMDGSVVIANGTITATQIAGQTITGDKIKANTIDAGHIQAGSITIGANAPIAPGTVAVPADVTAAINTAAADATSKANAAKTAAETAAKQYADGEITASALATAQAAATDAEEKANAARQAAITAAQTDATTKANQARIDAIAAAATDAQTKADAAKLAAETAAKAYADGEISEATAQALIDAAADAQTKADAAKLAAENAAKGYTDTTVAPINTKLGQWTKTGTTFIDGGQIFTDSITAGQIAAGAITTSELATDSVTAVKIKSGEITTAKIVVGGLDGTTAIANGTITTDKLNARAVTAEKIAVGAITIGGANGHIPDGAVALPADVTAAINTAAADATAKANQAKLDAEAAAEAYANGEISAAALVAAQDAQTKANAARDAAVLAASTDATNKANQARIDAINAAAQDAQTKADAAKLAAEQAAKAYADGEISEATAQALIDAAADAQTKANAAKTAAENAANAYTNTTVAPINTTLGNWRYQDTTFINGGSIYTNTITANQIAANTITADEIAANAITTSELAANSVTAGKILAGEITGEKLATNTAIINNLQIQSALTINHTNGHIKSSNWNDTNKTGFYMDQQQLIINQGKIKAAAIELQDSSNIMPPLYASFNANASAYGVAKFWRGSLSGTTKVANDGKFGGGSVQFVITANTGFVGMGASGTDLNIPIEGGNQYIISFYVSNRSSKVITLQPELYQTSAITIKGTATSIANSTAWVRHSVVVTAPATMTRAILRFNLTARATATFKLDGIQVEQKTGALDTPSNWSPPGYTSIDGESITTGEISSNQTINTGNGAIAKWSINTQGAARFGDVTVDGKLIVGGYGTDQTKNANVAIQSDQYSQGVSGWAIKGNGDVEFNNGTFRGILSLGTAANESIKPTMNASVSNVKLFINDSDHQDINVASIRGVTYAYDREQIGGEGPYYPRNPVASKIGRYYFGPTTDRSVNIQVHEGEEDAVYLETPPDDVALTSLFVGELTNPANEPVERERQGFGFSATRIETDPSTPSRKSSTGVSQSSSVQLRSPFYPESIEGEYPESTHLFESKIDFRAPISKNLFFRSYALPDLTISDGTTSRTNRPDYVSRAYDLTNEINKSTYVKVPVSGAGNPTGTKRHIFSAYIDTLDAFTDTAVYAFANNVPMNPIGDDKLSAGATQYQHADTLSTLAPDYRYEFNTAAASYSNSGSGSQVLTRTQGSVVTGPESSIFAFSNTRYTAPSTYNMNLGMTFSVWLQPTYVSGEQVFFHRGTANMREIWIRYNATNRTFTGGMVSASMTTWSAPNNLIDPAKWNQVTFTFDSIGAGTKNMRIYVNGVLQFTQVMSGWTTAFSTEPLYLFSNLQATSFYLGGLSEPMVFHKVLTAAQVTSLYNRGTPIYRAGGFSTLSQNGILVESGNAAQRVAFEYTPSSTVATTITLQVVGASSNTVLAYKIQLERASYQENVNLPARIRAKIAPTPWMTNGSNSLSTASLKLKAEPSPDIESWSISSLGDYQRMGPRGIEANKKKSPAELELSLSSSYSHPGGGLATSASATYKWGTTGMSYPGSKFPFMPAAASIIWDYNSLASASRPPIGGSGNLITTINLADSSFGAINTGAGKSLEDTFTASDGTQLGYPWIRVGTPDLPIYANTIRIRKFANTEFGIPSDFVYNTEPLIQTNQEVHIRVDSTVVTFGSTYRYNGALVINYDPNTDSGTFARVRDGGTRLWEVYVMNNGLITYSTSGTFSTAVNNWTDFKLRRENSNVRLTLGSVILFNGTIGTLPTGKYVGFSMDAGRMDDFNAYDIAPGSTAMGMLLPESVNVNEGRGIFVNPNGVIAVDVPGYYMVTGCVRGAIGGDIARTYWLEIFETRPGGNTKTHPISGWQNRSSSNMDYVFGSGICYLEGTVEFRIVTHTTNVSRISGADLHIVRMA